MLTSVLCAMAEKAVPATSMVADKDAHGNGRSRVQRIFARLQRWADAGWDAVDKADKDGKLFGIMIVQDRWKRPVLLFRNDWKASSVSEEEKYLELKPWSQPPIMDA